jgi:D-3-phosphoglycerate dehydrogenase
MVRVLVADKLAPEGMAVLQHAIDAGQLQVDERVGMKPDELCKAIGEYDGLIVRSASTVTKDVVEAASKLRVIGRAGIGVDNIDVEAATRRGIAVMNTPGGNNVTTAEHAISMLLSLARSIPQATASMKGGKWEKTKFTGSEISNKTLGIVGVGNIGRLVAERAQGLKMKVMAYDPFITEQKAREMGIELATLDAVLQRADFISIHTPLLPETRNLIDAAALAKMKPTARLVNCARGGIVDEVALADALRNKKLAGAALDVFEQEPVATDNPLLGLDNVVCTPHLGAATAEAQVAVSVAIAEQIVDFLVHNVTRHAVNLPSISAEQLDVLRPYLTLGERLGSLQAQLLEGAPQEIGVEYAGEVAAHDVQPVTIAVLKGLLGRLLETSVVNFVNARELAKERGIRSSSRRRRTRRASHHPISGAGSREASRRCGSTVYPGGARRAHPDAQQPRRSGRRRQRRHAARRGQDQHRRPAARSRSRRRHGAVARARRRTHSRAGDGPAPAVAEHRVGGPAGALTRATREIGD